MKTEKDDPITSGGGYVGLTKREHFASMILQGMMANSEDPYVDNIAASVSLADDLIERLNMVKEDGKAK